MTECQKFGPSSLREDTQSAADRAVVTWSALASVVSDILTGKRADDLNRDEVTMALAYGLIESREQTKPCPTCGTAKFDFRFWRVTGAGRLLVQAQGELAEARTANAVGTSAASAPPPIPNPQAREAEQANEGCSSRKGEGK